MGTHTRIYRLNDDLAINIPSNVLPPGRMQLVEERIETPGYKAETITWYPLLTGRRAKDGRIPMFIPYEVMQGLGLDPNKDVSIRLYGYRIWLRSHVHHRWPHKTVRDRRVWIPSKIVDRLKIPEYEYYDAIIGGTTMPRIEIILVEREVREVIVRHHGKDYETENYAPNKWRWIVPRDIECYHVMMVALGMNIYPDAECHREDDIILVDFIFSKPAGRIVSEKTGYAYRNMAVRNYTATTELDEYPFLCEIRATYISSCPKMFYQPDEIHHTPLKQALEITVYNMLKHFFPKIKEQYEYSIMSWADHIDAIDFTTTRVNLHRQYPRVKIDEPWKEGYLSYDTEGEGIPSEEFGVEEKRFYQCIKYVRVLNEASYKAQDIDRWVYTDMDITNMILERQRMRVMNGLKPEVEIDGNGFIWEVR